MSSRHPTRRAGARLFASRAIWLFGSCAVAAASNGGTAHAAAIDFVPRTFATHAWIETYASWENDDTDASAGKINWNDTFIREKLTVATDGYVYDPRFLLYKLSVGGACKQENYERSHSHTGGWDVGGAVEYDARVELLPDHPYNVQVFATRHEPVYRQQASSSHDNVADDYGLRLRYRKKPWFLDASFTDSKVDSAANDSDVKQLSIEGEYFRRFATASELSVNGSVLPSWYSDSTGLDGDSMQYSGGHTVRYRRLRLTGNVSQNRFDQHREDVSSYETEQFGAWEVLSLDLPYRFRVDATYRHHDDTSDAESEDPPQKTHYADKGDSQEVEAYHRLYESLDTRYRFLHDDRHSAGGHTEIFLHGPSLDYTKLIPHGRFIAGVNFSRSDIDNSGFADVVDEPYRATPVPGTIALKQNDVTRSSIVVVLQSPLPPFERITLVEHEHYEILENQPPKVELKLLPPQFAVPGTYDIFVSYSLESGDYELRSDITSASVTFEMFRNIVAPYFRYVAQRSKELSGDYPGIPVDADDYIAGLRLTYGPLRARGEYEDYDWDANPYRSGRAELQYVGAVTSTISAYATATYLNRHYFGAEPPYTTPDHTEESVTIAASLTKQFPYNLHVSVGGSWSSISSISDSNAWTANSSLVWRIGKLDVSFQANAYGSTSETPGAPDYERDHQFISINVRRQLL